jgi:hypothetical protein
MKMSRKSQERQKGAGEIPPSKFQVATSTSTDGPHPAGFCNLKQAFHENTQDLEGGKRQRFSIMIL